MGVFLKEKGASNLRTKIKTHVASASEDLNICLRWILRALCATWHRRFHRFFREHLQRKPLSRRTYAFSCHHSAISGSLAFCVLLWTSRPHWLWRLQHTAPPSSMTPFGKKIDVKYEAWHHIFHCMKTKGCLCCLFAGSTAKNSREWNRVSTIAQYA